jgi:hypothetical protein
MKAPASDLHKPNKPGAGPGLLALVVGIVVLVAAMQYLDALKEQGAALDDRETTIARAEQKFESISKAHRKKGNPQAAELMAQQRYATEPARDLIEGGWNPNIAFLSIELVTASRQINMTFETRSAQEALSYADWFQAQPGTENVTVKRQTEKPGPPAKSVETALQVTWKPFVANPLASASDAAGSEGAAPGASGAPTAPAATAAAPGTAAASAALAAAPGKAAAPAAAPAPAPAPSRGAPK